MPALYSCSLMSCSGGIAWMQVLLALAPSSFLDLLPLLFCA